MTQLVVAAEAETDTANILAYLAQEAGPRVAVDYGDRFRMTIERLVDMPLTVLRDRVLVPILESLSSRRTS